VKIDEFDQASTMKKVDEQQHAFFQVFLHQQAV
jgi:hypothetical protein